MEDQYYIDFQTFGLERLKKILKTGEVLPGRLILIEKLEARFNVLNSMSINNLSDLMTALSTKQKIKNFSLQ